MEEAVASTQSEGPDLGFPLGGWLGTVDYDGRFRFGCFPHLLIYLHQSRQWIEVGGDWLSTQRRAALPTPSQGFGRWEQSMTSEEFEARVQKAQRRIAAGEIYQVNLAHRFRCPIQENDLSELYERLRASSPAPMSAYLKQKDREILSSSPELFLRFSGSAVETRPIKGTRPRFADSKADLLSAHELQHSEKELAELIMITDLLRNDLGQVCEIGGVKVDALAQLESLSQVHHLVSTISGTLASDVSQVEALARAWPGGSITGAPKLKAKEVIAELETVSRGLYTGSIGYFGFNEESQFNIVIRSLVREEGYLSYHVGAGIVADSNPQQEYQETLDKARGIQIALAGLMEN
ncbi:MAG: anthranilate synthase component I family protein [Verrucomicrobiota bacterium]